MEENKDLEMNEETTEEVVETTEEVVEEAVEETAEQGVETDGTDYTFADPAEAFADPSEAFATEISAEKGKKKTVIAIIAAIVVIGALVGVGFATNLLPWNKYNHKGYVNITGRTMADVAEEAGMEYEELLKEYGLPEDMPKNTQESAAYYAMPVKAIAQMYGMDFATLKEMLGFGDDVTEDTEWGLAEGEVTVGKYVGEENFEEFKSEYGFGDEVTLETKWKEVRKAVDTASKKKYEEQKAEAEKAEEQVPVEETPAEEAPVEEAPVEEAPAEEVPAETPAE